MKTKLSAIFLVFICTLITSVAQIFYKKASATFQINILSLLTNYNLIIGMLLYFIAAFLLIMALRNGELSVLYPVIALSYIWVSLLSPMFFDDKMTLVKWLGVTSIFIGVSLIGIGSRK